MAARFAGRIASTATQCGFRLGCLAVRRLPAHWLFRFADLLASIGFTVARGFRLRSSHNIAAVFGHQPNGAPVDRLVRRSLRNFCRDVVEMGIALESSDDELRSLMPIAGREHLDGALEKGGGVILLSAHLGNFFLLGTRLAVEGYPIFVLVNQPSDSRFAELMDKYRLKVKQRTIHARPRREALKQVGEVLRHNEIALVIADEYRNRSGVPVPLFGGTVVARRGPASLALRTGAAVVPACVVRQSNDSLKMIIEPELELDRSGKGRAEIIENTARMTAWLERTVRKYPDQWNWMNIRWWETLPGTAPAKDAAARRAS